MAPRNVALQRDRLTYEQQGAWEAMACDAEMRRRYQPSMRDNVTQREMMAREQQYAWEVMAREREMRSRYPASSWGPAGQRELMARQYQYAMEESMARDQESRRRYAQSLFQRDMLAREQCAWEDRARDAEIYKWYQQRATRRTSPLNMRRM